ncbi:hypothetical protein LQ327_18150 [Actinomycetospora endophytica]|uniref:Phosphodiester glycosidase domain-containing protein n=1 Tax=Actinomycetospora endophytica TaxID=2291215 RepID=A0ABS8PE68_9PSEU|nr:hypothetical protein [Actinomycetospora endophytica]MCD2195294.1 hypothetical protein [Actinomycetospora endophytica]
MLSRRGDRVPGLLSALASACRYCWVDVGRGCRRWWPRRWWLRALSVVGVAVVVVGLMAAQSIVEALTRPGSDPVAARLAEWGRDHGLGPLVTALEAGQYEVNKPRIGGAPPGGIPRPPGAEAEHPGGQPAPPPLRPPVGVSPLPGEGQWQPVVSTPRGVAVRATTVRPDAEHTSFLVGVLWMDPTLVGGVLHPGTVDPGGHWSIPPKIDATEQRSVVTAFSAGFRLQGDSHGGWYQDGRQLRPLVPGAASMVIDTDGRVDVGAWGGEIGMGPQVAAVRQNLVPLVDNGVVNPTCATGGTRQWGSTVGQAAFISRSAFGVTPTGAMVYVGGPALSVCTLGELLRSAGVVRGMELDINPAWVSGVYFHPNGRPQPPAFELFPDQQIGTQHYLQVSSRDFFSFDLRSVPENR